MHVSQQYLPVVHHTRKPTVQIALLPLSHLSDRPYGTCEHRTADALQLTVMALKEYPHAGFLVNQQLSSLPQYQLHLAAPLLKLPAGLFYTKKYPSKAYQLQPALLEVADELQHDRLVEAQHQLLDQTFTSVLPDDDALVVEVDHLELAASIQSVLCECEAADGQQKLH